jgi:hypothetical protein
MVSSLHVPISYRRRADGLGVTSDATSRIEIVREVDDMRLS